MDTLSRLGKDRTLLRTTEVTPFCKKKIIVRTKANNFLDALASLDFKLSVSQRLMFFGFPVNSVIPVIPENPVIPVFQ